MAKIPFWTRVVSCIGSNNFWTVNGGILIFYTLKEHYTTLLNPLNEACDSKGKKVMSNPILTKNIVWLASNLVRVWGMRLVLRIQSINAVLPTQRKIFKKNITIAPWWISKWHCATLVSSNNPVFSQITCTLVLDESIIYKHQ